MGTHIKCESIFLNTELGADVEQWSASRVFGELPPRGLGVRGRKMESQSGLNFCPRIPVQKIGQLPAPNHSTFHVYLGGGEYGSLAKEFHSS